MAIVANVNVCTLQNVMIICCLIINNDNNNNKWLPNVVIFFPPQIDGNGLATNKQ